VPLTLQQIITEGDLLVANAFDVPTKIVWLNEINTEFFEIVKMPASATFSTVGGTAGYTLTSAVRGKNIVKVQVGTSLFPSFLFEDVSPGTNYHIYNDATYLLTLASVPSTTGLAGIIKYYQTASTTFVTGTLTVSPDAPQEYHWIYTLGLAARIAKAIPDIALANNYNGEYQANLAVAQQNFQRG
jgi:hypothetical protein